jgi:hypothetical protein
MVAMHASSAELIGAMISAIAIIRFWRIVLMLVVLAVICAVILGVAAVASHFYH